MMNSKKIWEVMIWLLVVSVVLNGAYFFLTLQSQTNDTVLTVTTILTPVMSAINYIVMGFAAGLGFYFAKHKIEK